MKKNKSLVPADEITITLKKPETNATKDILLYLVRALDPEETPCYGILVGMTSFYLTYKTLSDEQFNLVFDFVKVAKKRGLL